MTRGTYADVEVVERKRIRVAFHGLTDTAEVLAKLNAGDYYDITDDETYAYEKVVNVDWLSDDLNEEDD